MHQGEFDDLLAKLRPIIGETVDAFWLSTLLDPDRQKDIHAVAKALAAEVLGESYGDKRILLEPPPAKTVKGEYSLGTVSYANRPRCVFGPRESDLECTPLVGQIGLE